MKPKIFISHTQTDSAYAELLSDLLQERGLEIWTDTKLKPGVSWDKAFKKALEESKLFIALISNDYFKSQYALMELGGAFVSNKKIVPILLSGDIEQMPFRFSKYHVVDAQKTDKDALLQIIEQQTQNDLAA